VKSVTKKEVKKIYSDKKNNTSGSMLSKDFTYDGKSRPSTDKYRENFERIFGKKIKNSGT